MVFSILNVLTLFHNLHIYNLYLLQKNNNQNILMFLNKTHIKIKQDDSFHEQ